ncbi:hypothetical protein H0E87_028487 [Populus deltoides]|uniref:Uncharacterized protein n=1 Tax=Populus deltoides TaxID=3696 RepID=A0A8T2WWE0_POPDE|nr:hypothetical protein H0E87_028487 [Populus deltoides]
MAFIAAYSSLLLGFAGLAWTSGEGNIHAILFLACAILCSYVYQVRLGTERGSRVVKVAVTMLYSLLFAFGLKQSSSFSLHSSLFSDLTYGKLVSRLCRKNYKDKGRFSWQKYFCVRLHALFRGCVGLWTRGS